MFGYYDSDDVVLAQDTLLLPCALLGVASMLGGAVLRGAWPEALPLRGARSAAAVLLSVHSVGYWVLCGTVSRLKYLGMPFIALQARPALPLEYQGSWVLGPSREFDARRSSGAPPMRSVNKGGPSNKGGPPLFFPFCDRGWHPLPDSDQFPGTCSSAS